MYPTSAGLKYLVSLKTQGTGKFLGAEFGRARATLDTGNGFGGYIYVASRVYGALSNSITVQLVDMGNGVEIPETKIEQSGTAIRVILRRTVNGIQATTAEVVAALNNYTSFQPSGFALGARYNSDVIVDPVGPIALTGGADPAIEGSQYRWTGSSNTNMGLVHFEQQHPVWLLGVHMKFGVQTPGPYTVRVERVRLNKDFTPVMDESIPIYVWDFLTGDKPDIAYTSVEQIIHPGQAVLITTTGGGFGGIVELDVQRAAEFPYA